VLLAPVPTRTKTPWQQRSIHRSHPDGPQPPTGSVGDGGTRTTTLFIFVSFPQRFLDDVMVIHVCEDYEML